MNISGGRVQIEDGTKAKEEYAPARKVIVELRFEVPEGGDGSAMLDSVALQADNKLRQLLDRPTIARVAPAADIAISAIAAIAAEKPKVAKPKAPAASKATEKTKAELAKELGLPTTDTVHKAPEAALGEPEAPAAPVQTDIEDELESLGIAAPAPITDKELGDAASKKMAELKTKHGEKFDPTAIRSLLTSYYEGGTRIASIPVAKRPEFLAKLSELK